MKNIFRKKHETICHPELVSGSDQPCDATQDWSDSEQTQSLQTSNDGCFRMTPKRHTEEVKRPKDLLVKLGKSLGFALRSILSFAALCFCSLHISLSGLARLRPSANPLCPTYVALPRLVCRRIFTH